MNQEIADLANKLHQNGIAKSRMDAIKMAESMLSIKVDTSIKKSRISNLEYRDEPIEKKKETSAPIETPVNVGVDNFQGKTLQELDTEVKEEIEGILQEPDSMEDEITEREIEEPKLLRREETIINDEASEADIREKIEIVDIEPVDEIGEQEISKELSEPALLEEEQKIAQEEVLEKDIEVTITPFEQAVKDFQEDPDVPERTQQIPATSENKGKGLTDAEKEMTDITKLFSVNK